MFAQNRLETKLPRTSCANGELIHKVEKSTALAPDAAGETINKRRLVNEKASDARLRTAIELQPALQPAAASRNRLQETGRSVYRLELIHKTKVNRRL